MTLMKNRLIVLGLKHSPFLIICIRLKHMAKFMHLNIKCKDQYQN